MEIYALYEMLPLTAEPILRAVTANKMLADKWVSDADGSGDYEHCYFTINSVVTETDEAVAKAAVEEYAEDEDAENKN